MAERPRFRIWRALAAASAVPIVVVGPLTLGSSKSVDSRDSSSTQVQVTPEDGLAGQPPPATPIELNCEDAARAMGHSPEYHCGKN